MIITSVFVQHLESIEIYTTFCTFCTFSSLHLLFGIWCCIYFTTASLRAFGPGISFGSLFNQLRRHRARPSQKTFLTCFGFLNLVIVVVTFSSSSSFYCYSCCYCCCCRGCCYVGRGWGLLFGWLLWMRL